MDKNIIKNLITITGARGLGKTRLGLTFLPPSQRSKMVILDAERSSNNILARLKKHGHAETFEGYIDLEDVEERYGFPDEDNILDRVVKDNLPWANEKERDAMLSYYRYILKTLSEIPKDKYKCLVLDTGQKFEYGMRAWVDYNMAKFGLSKDWAKAEANLLRPLYENVLNGIWGRGIETIIFTFHLRNVWDKRIKAPIPNKVQMAGNPTVLFQRSSLMLWLVPEPLNTNGEPAGLVIKERMGEFDIDVENDKYIQKRLLPYRIPICDWEHINQYLEVGCDLTNLQTNEKWSDDERDMASEFLSNIQMKMMIKDLEIQEMEKTLALVDAGIVGNNVSFSDKSATDMQFSESGGVPKTRSEAIATWKASGKKLPDLLKHIAGLSDDQITAQWETINAK